MAHARLGPISPPRSHRVLPGPLEGRVSICSEQSLQVARPPVRRETAAITHVRDIAIKTRPLSVMGDSRVLIGAAGAMQISGDTRVCPPELVIWMDSDDKIGKTKE